MTETDRKYNEYAMSSRVHPTYSRPAKDWYLKMKVRK